MASYAAAIQEQLGIDVHREKGRVGQFEVLVNGQSVVSRRGGLLAKLTGKPWPAVDDVVSRVESAIRSGEPSG